MSYNWILNTRRAQFRHEKYARNTRTNVSKQSRYKKKEKKKSKKTEATPSSWTFGKVREDRGAFIFTFADATSAAGLNRIYTNFSYNARLEKIEV